MPEGRSATKGVQGFRVFFFFFTSIAARFLVTFLMEKNELSRVYPWRPLFFLSLIFSKKKGLKMFFIFGFFIF